MLISIPKKLQEHFKVNISEHLEHRYLRDAVFYVIDSKFRTSVRLTSWINKQVSNPTPELRSYADSIQAGESDDVTMINILRKVNKDLVYKPDKDVWGMSEKWQEASVTLSKKTGDCEDGALLIYVIGRLKGVSASKLFIFAGDVRGGGHAWLGYRPDDFPLNWCFLDWCYWYDKTSIGIRDKFYVNQKNITQYNYSGVGKSSNYYKMWFCFNENYSYRELTFKIKP